MIETMGSYVSGNAVRPRSARAAIALATIGGALLLCTSAQACTKTWLAGSGDWTNPSAWSPAGVPVATDDVCLPAGATYTVTVPAIAGGGATVQSIAVGGVGPGSVTLQILGSSVPSAGATQQFAALTATAGGTIAANGTLVLDATDTGARATLADTLGGAATLAGGTIQNAGTIVAQSESQNQQRDYLRASVANGLTGTLQITNGLLYSDNGSTFQNLGSVAANGSGSWVITTDRALSVTPTHVINSGNIATNGGVQELDASWTQAGGVIRGGTVSLQDSKLDYETGSGGFDFLPDADATPSSLAGTIPSGQTITTAGTTLQLLGAQVENDGTLTLEPALQYGGTVLIGAPLVNIGQLTFTNSLISSATDATLLRTGILNQAQVSLYPGATVAQDAGTSFTNGGTLVLEPGALYALSAHLPLTAPSTFTNFGFGTVEFDLGKTSTGQIDLGPGSSMIAGGTLLALTDDYTPFQGQSYSAITSAGGVLADAFTAINGGVRALTSSTSTLSLVFGQAVKRVAGGRRSFTVQDTCPSGGLTCPELVVRATATERTRHTIGKGRKRRTVVRTATVVVASAHARLSFGESRKLVVKLNARGRALLARSSKGIAVKVTAASEGVTLVHTTVRVRR